MAGFCGHWPFSQNYWVGISAASARVTDVGVPLNVPLSPYENTRFRCVFVVLGVCPVLLNAMFLKLFRLRGAPQTSKLGGVGTPQLASQFGHFFPRGVSNGGLTKTP